MVVSLGCGRRGEAIRWRPRVGGVRHCRVRCVRPALGEQSAQFAVSVVREGLRALAGGGDTPVRHLHAAGDPRGTGVRAAVRRDGPPRGSDRSDLRCRRRGRAVRGRADGRGVVHRPGGASDGAGGAAGNGRPDAGGARPLRAAPARGDGRLGIDDHRRSGWPRARRPAGAVRHASPAALLPGRDRRAGDRAGRGHRHDPAARRAPAVEAAAADGASRDPPLVRGRGDLGVRGVGCDWAVPLADPLVRDHGAGRRQPRPGRGGHGADAGQLRGRPARRPATRVPTRRPLA